MFSGIGGFRSGLEAAGGFECIGFCEIDKNAADAYRAIYNTESEAYFNDAREINTSELGDFDLLVAGFPCQPFSTAGKRLGFSDIINSHILNDIERICDRGIIIKKGVQMGVWNKSDNNMKTLEEIFLDLVGGVTE